MLTKFTYRLLTLLLLLQGLLLSAARAQIIKTAPDGISCEVTPECKKYPYEFIPGPDQTFLRWQVRGDAKLLSPETDNPAIICSAGYGKARITAHYYSLRKDEKCRERCPDTLFYSLDYDLFKQFSPPDPIRGPSCVLPGQTVTYSVPPILTDWPHRREGIGTDSYFWSGFPAGSQLFFSGDSSSVTVALPPDLTGGFTVLVGVGRCNVRKPAELKVNIDQPLNSSLVTVCPSPSAPGALGVSIGTVPGVAYQVFLPAGWHFANGTSDTLTGNGQPQTVYFTCDGSPGNVLITATGGCSGPQTAGLAFTINP